MRRLTVIILILLSLITGVVLFNQFKSNFFGSDSYEAATSVSYDGTTNFDPQAAKVLEAKTRLLHPDPDPTLEEGMYLEIPKIDVKWHVLSGGNADQKLLEGFWQYPNTPTPEQGGNTIILGHRWVYKPPDQRTLYALDKLQNGDILFVQYQKRRYKYETTESFITDPKDPRQLEPIGEPMLTVITSHPIEEKKVLSKQRLVVRAKMVPNH